MNVLARLCKVKGEKTFLISNVSAGKIRLRRLQDFDPELQIEGPSLSE
jgi:hypothetical protein